MPTGRVKRRRAARQVPPVVRSVAPAPRAASPTRELRRGQAANSLSNEYRSPIRLEESRSASSQRRPVNSAGYVRSAFHLDEIRVHFESGDRTAALARRRTGVGANGVFDGYIDTERVGTTSVEQRRAGRDTNRAASDADRAVVLIADLRRSKYRAESERVGKIDQYRRYRGSAVGRIHATVKKGVRPGARRTPFPRHVPPHSPVVIVIRLRIRQLLTGAIDAQRSLRRRP